MKKDPKGPPPITTDTVMSIRRNPHSVDRRTVDEIRRLSAQYNFFHWHIEFAQVFAEKEGFDCVLGNPPWVSFTGRQQIKLPDQELNLIKRLFPSVASWPAAHPSFMVLSTILLKHTGFSGLVLPLQIANLDSYKSARLGVVSAGFCVLIKDIGESAFHGVTQPAGLFTLYSSSDGLEEMMSTWSASSKVSNTGVDIILTHSLKSSERDVHRILEAMKAQPRFLLKTFADPGVHTGNVSKKLIRDHTYMEASDFAPVREGRDISAFKCDTPRRSLWTTPDLLSGEYCTIRNVERYRSVPILIRQTANRPIAARHDTPTYFRNSLLACYGVSGVPHSIVVAYLNSNLYALLHRTLEQDAHQKAFPQVKVSHLHKLPTIPIESLNSIYEGRTLLETLEQAVIEAEMDASSNDSISGSILEMIDKMVLVSFDLSPVLTSVLMEEVL